MSPAHWTLTTTDGTPGRPKLDRCLNEAWPPNPRDIPDQKHPIDIIARVVWEKAGTEVLEGRAIRWTRTHVMVTLPGCRTGTIGVWLKPEDV